MVLPYMHGLKTAKRHDVKVPFSLPQKLTGMCKKVNAEPTQENTEACQTKHITKYVECKSCVVHHILLTYRKVYIGQTGRCLNDRLRKNKHRCQLITTPRNLAGHCKYCKCSVLLYETAVIGKAETKTEREISEALASEKERGQCVSTPPIMLT